MATITLKPERMLQLEEYAQRHGQDPATALDVALEAYFDWDRQDCEEVNGAIREDYEDMIAGRTKPSDEVFEELRKEYVF